MAASSEAAAPPTEVGDAEPEVVCIFGLPRYANIRVVEQLLSDRGVAARPKKVTVTPRIALVRFTSADAGEAALATLQAKDLPFKGHQLSFKQSVKKPPKHKRPADGDDASAQPDAKRPQRSVEDAVTPLHALAYEHQLVKKSRSIKSVLCDLPKRLKKAGVVRTWLTPDTLSSRGGRCCDQADVMSSPSTTGYRNKCEFTIGLDAAGEPCVGFKVGAYKEGHTTVGEPSNCLHISDEMKRVCAALTRVARASGLAVHQSMNAVGSGFWRQVLLKQNTFGELLISLQFNPSGLEGEVVDAQLEAAFRAASEVATIACTYKQPWTGCSDAPHDLPHTHVAGARELAVQLRGLTFHVSPNAFFQVNTAAADQLGGVLADIVGSIGSDAVLLDVCCGTGVWGLCLAERAAKVVGLELSADAVQDARRNAEANGISNAEFLCGRAEDLIANVIATKVGDRPCVAIVDPPRSGLHATVVQALRACEGLRHLVYVSCNPTTWLDDAERLCRNPSSKYPGQPFQPLRAQPIDLFPHTNHCELIVHFERERDPKSADAV